MASSRARVLKAGFVAIAFAVPLLLARGMKAQPPQAAPKQAVVETSLGTFVFDLTPEAAPNQVAYFTKVALEGGYDGTTFHTMFRNAMIQGGDPLSKDPAKRAVYGTGGQNAVKAEARAQAITLGSVAAVLVPGMPDSAGAQFYVFLADQPSLANQLTVFGKVTDGLDVLQKISETPLDASRHAVDRVEIRHVTIRDAPVEPFVSETREELSRHLAILDTSAGPIALEFFADKAPETVRQFLRLAHAGVYDGTAFHRVVPGFVIQTGALSSRTTPLTEKQQKLAHNLQPEFNDTKHVKGIVSMARGDAPDSATTSFFIVTGSQPALDGVYTAFARVVDGMPVVEKIEAAPRTGETPNERIELRGVRIEDVK
jgi:cyclophilin family peptidyl-prolyl cis-trans isomerase